MFRLQIPAKRRFSRQELSRWLRFAGAGISTFFLSNVRLLGSLSPFGTALVMALPSGLSAAAAAGGFLGYALLGSFEKNLPYLAALLCAIALKLLLNGYPRLRNRQSILCTLTTLSLAVPITVSGVLAHASAAGILIGLAESLLGGAMTCFCIQSLQTLPQLCSGEPPAAPAPIQTASLLITFLTILTGICGLQISIFNVGRILGALLLLCVAARLGPSAAAVSGLSLAAALTLYSPDFAVSGGILALSGMICAVFSRFGRVVQSTLFVLVNTAGVLVTGGAPETLTAAFDVLAASAGFLLLPAQALDAFRRRSPVSSRKFPHANARAADRLRFAAGTIAGIRESVDAISQRLRRTGASDLSGVCDQVSDRVCRRCGLKLFCWETAYNQAAEALQKMIPVLREKGKAAPEDLPRFFQNNCPRTSDLLRELNGCYHAFLSRESASRKVMEAKQVALEQLDGIAEMLRDAGDDLANDGILDESRAAEAARLLEDLGEDPGQVYCILERCGRMRLELYRDSPLRADKAMLTEELSRLLERPLDQPCTVTAGDLTRICFFEQAQFTLDYHAVQKNAGGCEISGDCCEYFADPRGFAHLILSDGMGSGGRAAVDSILTCNFILRLVKAGFGFDAALKLINSALLVKAGDESLATLDICCVDLYTGAAEFLKAGGAPTFLCRDGKIASVPSGSLPAGILQGIGYDRRSVSLMEGDLIVMVSDGALPDSEEQFKERLLAVCERTPKEIAETLAEEAARWQKQPADDITVIAARLVLA